MQVMIIDVPSRERGLAVLDRVEQVIDVANVAVRDTALVYRADDGRTRIRQTRDIPAATDNARGAGLGALLGLISSRAATEVATEPAAVTGPVLDDRLIKRVAQHIDEAKAAVVLLGDDATIDFLSGTADLAEHDIEYLTVRSATAGSDEAGFTRYG